MRQEVFPTLRRLLPPPSREKLPQNSSSRRGIAHATSSPFILETGVSYTPTVNPNQIVLIVRVEQKSSAVNIGYERFLEMHIGNPEWSNEYWSHLTDRPNDTRYSSWQNLSFLNFR